MLSLAAMCIFLGCFLVLNAMVASVCVCVVNIILLTHIEVLQYIVAI
jgi:hypothetical protein